MSSAELTRLQQDLNKNLGLYQEFEELAEDARLGWVRDKGYDVTEAEIAELADEDALSDDDLERVAGGWSGEGDGG